MATKKRNQIRINQMSDSTFEIISSHANKEKRSNGVQAEIMLEQFIKLKKLKPCK